MIIIDIFKFTIYISIPGLNLLIMEKSFFKFNPDRIDPGDLNRKEIKEICEEISARQFEELPRHDLATEPEQAVRQDQDLERATSNYGLEYNPFLVDRNRIQFSKAFARMKDKTQTVTTPSNPHVSNRLTHTLRVASVGKTIARSLGLNEDLTEAIALGHDLGHVPFGHAGEIHMASAMLSVRSDILRVLGAFKHNMQSLHVVDRVETRTGFEKGRGLNLTDQVRHGILSHDGERDLKESAPDMTLIKDPSKLRDDIKDYVKKIIKATRYRNTKNATNGEKAEKAFKSANTESIKPGTPEAAIVAMVDVLTYTPQDFEDQISLGVVKRNELPFSIARELGEDGASMINRLAENLMVHSYATLDTDKPRIKYTERLAELVNKLKRNFLYPHYYEVNSLAAVYGKDERVLQSASDIQERYDYLFRRFLDALKDPGKHKHSPVFNYMDKRSNVIYGAKMKEIYGERLNSKDDEAYLIACIMDFIAGFTDNYFFKLSDQKYK